MNEQSQLVITNAKGDDVTTSHIIAQVFGKNHADVLRDIRNLKCSDEFRKRNFAEMFDIKVLPNNGHRYDRYYEITKDGFSFLVMGYTGKKAATFKEGIIREFNYRESLLKSDDYMIDRALKILAKRMEMPKLD
ncbi:MAG: Rha family transcriptional regulator [Bacteroidales bacterium]|nr:Rha family transcriptional regulator [Bacteroidales bacterium]